MPKTPSRISTKPILFVERLLQDRRGKQRDRQRHDPGKQRAGMRGGREQQASVCEQDRSAAAKHDRRQPNPAETREGKALAHDVRQQKQTGHAKAKRSDIPWCEAGPESQAGHHDPSRPDADGGEAVESAADIFRSGASRDDKIRHHRLPTGMDGS
jgi:hypothetical protein